MPDFEHLICPVCQKPLIKASQGLTCLSGHCFDIAGKGYVNLLLSRDKNSRDPGDSKEMAKARKRFLDKGYYASLADGLYEFAAKYMIYDKGCFFLDAGCGDGYYTHYLRQSLKGNPSSFYGVDISKEAIRLAASRDREIGFIVASLFKIPIAEHQADFILNAFAPSSDSEFSRILKKDGRLITVIPGKSHLIELKEILYKNAYENDEKGPELPSFRIEEQVRVKAIIEINNIDDLSDLVAMTPYYWRTPREGLERLNKLTRLSTTIEFIISLSCRDRS